MDLILLSRLQGYSFLWPTQDDFDELSLLFNWFHYRWIIYACL